MLHLSWDWRREIYMVGRSPEHHGWPSTQPSRPAHNRASRSTQPGTDTRLCAAILGNMAAAKGGTNGCFKQTSNLKPTSNFKAQFAVCDYTHNVLHIIWLIMDRNRKAYLANVNIICLHILSCVHCARLCVSARLCVFLLDCVLCLARSVLVKDGMVVFHDVITTVITFINMIKIKTMT